MENEEDLDIGDEICVSWVTIDVINMPVIGSFRLGILITFQVCMVEYQMNLLLENQAVRIVHVSIPCTDHIVGIHELDGSHFTADFLMNFYSGLSNLDNIFF